MDLLRAVLQPSINEEIQTVFNKYMKFFQKAALNVRDNIGEGVDAEQLIQEACRSCLEQAKLLFSDGEKVIPRLTHELPGIKRGRQAEEECAHRGSPVPKKRKGRPPGHILSNDRAAAGMVWKPKSCEPIRREGPKWDPARLNESTTFVLGSRANKALGMGGTRGRIYIKHPHLFKHLCAAMIAPTFLACLLCAKHCFKLHLHYVLELSLSMQLTPRTSTGWQSSITCGQQGGRWPTFSSRRTSGTSLPAMTTGAA
ncbi:deoxynucleotidyltransferase terminal-interacting protein 1 isoform X2 [Trichechus manatus latirostris]|uniref:Deoxynucleotidyltransferase terminal-interacting protein 1 n=1 Tax=Trichechus manatus latirostris TaxID=127582 RepID=A0A2Y9QET4_TRIMA|nr:deoxynucleotidyltransferase terminal-interacting protein 1 isoform X2 [Trichechus manatus latirostris]